MDYGDMTIQDEAVVLPKNDVGHFTRDTSLASGTQAVTGIGFRPSSILFHARQTGDEVSWGFGHSSSDREIHLDVGAAISGSTNRSIFLTDGANSYQGDILSLDADGFTVSWTKSNSPTGTATINFMAFK